MKIETTCRIPVGARITRGGFRRILCSLFLVAAVVAAVGAVAPSRASQGLMRVSNALPASIIVVTNTNDGGPGSLRNALAVAKDGDTIDATGVSGTILLTSGELQITHNVTINGPGAGSLAVNGNRTFRVFENFASNVTISGFTITNGRDADGNGGGGILNHGGLTLSENIVSNSTSANSLDYVGLGGGICNNPGATLTVTGTKINGNYVGCGAGGGIYTSDAQLTVMNSIISGNGVGVFGLCGGFGGGIFYKGGGTLTVTNTNISGNGAADGGGIGSDLPGDMEVRITDSTISENSAVAHLSGSGGGISNHGHMLTVTNTTISDNSARFTAAGIANNGNLTVTNSTFSGNSTAVGGGIGNSGNLTVTNSTFSDNSAGEGGAIENGGAAQIEDTVLNAGTVGGTIFNDGGTVSSLGHNLANDDGGGVLTGPGDQINTDPMLGPLQNNGGPTFTHALLPGSPAINAGDGSFTPPPFFDQRGAGFDRVVNGRIDIGSFEIQSAPTPTPRPWSTPRPRPTVPPRPTL